MRVTTDFWVSALVRRVFSEGGFAAVIRRGATEAGAVFVTTRDKFGEYALFGPAPQSTYEEAKPDERYFTTIATAPDAEAIDARLAREARFDSDIWIVEIEPGSTSVAELLSIRTL